ncbi:phage portal protein family protein, partial [Enterobacter asburiae]
VWPYLFKNYSVRDLAEFLEIYGLPPRIGSYMSGASQDEQDKLMEALVSIGHNASGIIPDNTKIEFKDA